MTEIKSAALELGTESIRKLLVQYAVPAVIAMTAASLYNMVDSIFIGHGVGPLAISGLALTFPLMNLAAAFGSLVGVGAATLISMRLGQKDYASAQYILGNVVVLNFIIGLGFGLVTLLFLDPILYFFGASEATIGYARDYMSIILMGNVITHMYLGLNSVLRASGHPRKSMYATIYTVVINAALDPLFIYGFGWGIRGAAIATVLSQLASCVYAVRFLLGKKPPIRITRGGYSAAVMRRVLTLGFSPFIIIALDNVMIIAMNAVLQHYGGAARGDALVTCATIAQSFMLVVTMPLGGITGGTQSILSYNYGAYRTERVRQAQKYIFGLGLAFTAVMTLAARLAGPLFVRLFTTDEALAAQAFDTIKVCTLALLPLGLQYEVVDGFTALGLAKLALPLSLWRKAVYFAAVFALPAFFGADAVFYAEPISDVLGPLASVAVYCVCIRGVLARRAALAPQKLPN